LGTAKKGELMADDLSDEMEDIFQTLVKYPLFKYSTQVMFDEWNAEGEDGSDVWDQRSDALTIRYVEKEQEDRLKGV
jgi:hypothetical protein